MPEANEPKKETVRITLPPRPPANPVGSATPSRDTVRINLPARPPQNGTDPVVQPPRRLVPPPPQVSGGAPPPRPPIARPPIPAPSATAVRPPSYSPPPRSAVAPAPRPLPPAAPPVTAKAPPMAPPLRPTASAQAAVAPAPDLSSASMPKKETARIAILPDPPKPTTTAVKMTKTQPLIANLPVTTSHPVAVNVAHTEIASTFDSIPMPLCWAVFGISAVTLLIELWNYLA